MAIDVESFSPNDPSSVSSHAYNPLETVPVSPYSYEGTPDNLTDVDDVLRGVTSLQAIIMMRIMITTGTFNSTEPYCQRILEIAQGAVLEQ